MTGSEMKLFFDEIEKERVARNAELVTGDIMLKGELAVVDSLEEGDEKAKAKKLIEKLKINDNVAKEVQKAADQLANSELKESELADESKDSQPNAISKLFNSFIKFWA